MKMHFKTTFAAALLAPGLLAGPERLRHSPLQPLPKAAADLRVFKSAGAPHPGYVLAAQICLDRRGLSCNTLDGSCGRKTQVALATWCALKGLEHRPGEEEFAWERLFPGETNLFTTIVVTAADRAALVKIPSTPAAKSAMKSMGYETLQEAYAERGRLSQSMLRKLNPRLAWPDPPVGSMVTVPYFPETSWKREASSRRMASVLRISLSRFEITAFDAAGGLIALFPCSIAADKRKLPAEGELRIKTIVPRPNYTYTPEGGRGQKRIFPPGPNNPVGSAWIGLDLPGYGMHGTPNPERVGCAESHGCFRLANWNAVRLRKMCDVGVSVVVEK